MRSQTRASDRQGPIGVGLVGAGVIGALHADALARLPEARLVAVADPAVNAGQPLADRHGAAWMDDDAALLARDDIDFVILATPSGLHPEQAVRAAQAGKHVIVEKPMAISVAGIDRMIAGCAEAGVQLAVIFQNRFQRDVVLLKRAVAAGLLGRPLIGNAFVHWQRTPEYYKCGGWRGTWALDGGGALMNQSIHTIDILHWIMGPVSSVAAEVATLRHEIEAEDTATAALRFAMGALGTIQGTTAASADWPVRVEIVGTAGRAVLERGRLRHWEAEREPDVALLTEDDRQWTEGAEPGEPFGDAHARQLRAIFAAIRAGGGPPVSGAEARLPVETILAIYESARSGRRVVLREEVR